MKLDDWELVKGCKDTGIITQIGFKHLDYIRDMRNHASAAHLIIMILRRFYKYQAIYRLVLKRF